MYSAFSDYVHVSAALSMGARGYLSKAEGIPVLKEAMLRTAQGEVVIENTYHKRVTAPLIDSLTAREKEILLCLQKGWNDTHIRQELGISQRTVETYLHRIYTKLGIDSRKALSSLKISAGAASLKPAAAAGFFKGVNYEKVYHKKERTVPRFRRVVNCGALFSCPAGL